MITITLDDQLINEVIAVSHNQNVQEAVVKILADYLQKHKKETAFFEQLRWQMNLPMMRLPYYLNVTKTRQKH